mmetsp:Transcript_3058/g.9417  ORF Transcript_3058/g.9417 Transcript_3058/m.9417 type:complete len:273 (-) Transcript_3058:232-1050(-)
MAARQPQWWGCNRCRCVLPLQLSMRKRAHCFAAPSRASQPRPRSSRACRRSVRPCSRSRRNRCATDTPSWLLRAFAAAVRKTAVLRFWSACARSTAPAQAWTRARASRRAPECTASCLRRFAWPRTRAREVMPGTWCWSPPCASGTSSPACRPWLRAGACRTPPCGAVAPAHSSPRRRWRKRPPGRPLTTLCRRVRLRPLRRTPARPVQCRRARACWWSMTTRPHRSSSGASLRWLAIASTRHTTACRRWTTCAATATTSARADTARRWWTW